MKVKEYQDQLSNTLKNISRQEFWEKCFIAAMNGIITSAPADAGSTARMAAQYADAMVEQWEKRR
jgi:hypothetical protein